MNWPRTARAGLLTRYKPGHTTPELKYQDFLVEGELRLEPRKVQHDPHHPPIQRALDEIAVPDHVVSGLEVYLIPYEFMDKNGRVAGTTNATEL